MINPVIYDSSTILITLTDLVLHKGLLLQEGLHCKVVEHNDANQSYKQ